MHVRAERSFDEHYNNLTQDQILTIYTHQGFGFVLWFVRKIDNDKRIAVLKQGEKLVSVNSNGVAKDEIDIELRNMDSVNPDL